MSFDSYFFTRPSFGRGFVRAIDVYGDLGREAIVLSNSTDEADARALRSDVAVVGRDMQRAIDTCDLSGSQK